MPLSAEQETWLRKLEALSDLELRQLAEKPPGAFAPPDETLFAQHVLADRESRKRTERENETLSIAKEANRLAERANRLATIAAAAATIAAVAAVIALASKMLSWPS